MDIKCDIKVIQRLFKNFLKKFQPKSTKVIVTQIIKLNAQGRTGSKQVGIHRGQCDRVWHTPKLLSLSMAASTTWAGVVRSSSSQSQGLHQTMPLRSCGRWGFGITGPISSLRQAPGESILCILSILCIYPVHYRFYNSPSTNKFSLIILVYFIG